MSLWSCALQLKKHQELCTILSSAYKWNNGVLSVTFSLRRKKLGISHRSELFEWLRLQAGCLPAFQAEICFQHNVSMQWPGIVHQKKGAKLAGSLEVKSKKKRWHLHLYQREKRKLLQHLGPFGKKVFIRYLFCSSNCCHTQPYSGSTITNRSNTSSGKIDSKHVMNLLLTSHLLTFT